MMKLETQNKRANRVHIMLLIYWAVLVAWQNLGLASNRSGADTILKVALLGLLTLFFFFNAGKTNMNALWAILFAAYMIFELFLESGTTLGNVVAYLYPAVLAFLLFVPGNDYQISKKQLLFFLNAVILIVAYMAIYALLFCRDQFASALSISSAYGNELSSFLISNHEYGMYLMFAMTGCIICLELKKNCAWTKKWFYIAAMVLFAPNLILTFSRTSMLAMVCVLLVYLILSKKSRLKTVIVVVLFALVLAFLFSSTLKSFLFDIILKGNNDSGRDNLSRLAIEYFNRGDWFKKLFGHGISSARSFFDAETSHGSVHNSYLQVLLYHGIVGLGIMLLFILGQIVASITLIKKNRFMGTMLLASLLSAIAMMFTNTSCIFFSAIDSYFLTVMAIIIPKYVRNAIMAGTFDEEVPHDTGRTDTAQTDRA